MDFLSTQLSVEKNWLVTSNKTGRLTVISMAKVLEKES